MDLTEAITAIDALVKLSTFLTNAIGANNQVGAIIATRIAAGSRDWTDEEKKIIADALSVNKQYALDQLAKPDAENNKR